MTTKPLDVIKPAKGQESVWDYPRPPRVEAVSPVVRVELAGRTVAESRGAVRILETASPPTYYMPPSDVDESLLEPSALRSFCEWKGTAHYWTLRVGEHLRRDAAWSYPDPLAPYRALREYLAFYPSLVDACWVGDQQATPQPGERYGGWITPNVVGPFKGEAGSEHW